MALQTNTTIKIGETIIKNFSHLKINQEIHDHHTFSIEVRHDLLVSEFESVMPVSQRLSGEKISIEIKAVPDLDDLMVVTNPQDYIMQFYGIVTKVTMRKSRMMSMEETILIEGYSESIILDSGPESHSFTSMSMEAIVNKVMAEYDIAKEVNPFHSDNLPYTVQYNESDFDFLNRLAMRYGQWFFYNGRMMVFGGPGGGIPPKLMYGVNMHDFSYDIKLAPALFKVIEDDNRKGQHSVDQTLQYRNEVDGFHQNFINKSNLVFSKETVVQLNQNAVGGYGDSASKEYAKNKMRSAMSSMMQVEASSEVPGITVGSNVRISGVDIQLESTYRVTQITHTCDDGGSYENYFTAVNFSGAVFSPRTNPDLIPRCESQSAVIISNNDPDGLGGLKVQMLWQEAKGETTPFIPMVQPHGGGGKGFYFIPEVGERVFLDFQSGNAEMPVVVGTLSSKNSKTTYHSPNNDIKGIRTRSGIETLSNDAKGSWKQSTPDGNYIELDGSRNITNNAVVNMTNNVGEKMSINVGGNEQSPTQCIVEMDNEGRFLMTTEKNVAIYAKENITFQVGKSSITITKGGIELKSDSIALRSIQTAIYGKGSARAIFNDTTQIDGSQVFIK
ncbi:contractile injection system protein, VgrG/Pvc8 family [Flavobacterium panici]|uniref:contractile injection system protein, VgrG/Pvc8 family n=1 Tax=Flavobacterium panici TaxID=2654843 RepID=UPI00211436BF|nr:contractile injection system protein, VgrG/Pvc8 family [Flavobacterium panici]UUF13567.1 contractile injection system protein, VgrG/Pvc8 family [Flavobacterium panici]